MELGKKEDVLAKVKDELKDKFEGHYAKGDHRLYLNVKKEAIRNCIRLLFESMKARLSTISAVDLGDRFEVVYHLTFDEFNLVVNVKCSTPKIEAKIDSVTGIVEGASWIEREIKDLFGIEFVGHPNPERLILPDEWPGDWTGGEYPLRKRR